VVAEGAFVDVTVRTHDKARIIRTGGDTGLAARALLGRNQDDVGILPVMTCPRWTAGHTGGMGTVITALGAILGTEMRILTACYLHHPIAIETGGELVFVLAGDDTVSAADAGPGINHHGVGNHLRPLRAPG
jgi:hypothetical protein